MFMDKFNETPENRFLRRLIENLQNKIMIFDDIIIKQIFVLTDMTKMMEEQIQHFAKNFYTLVINADVNIKQLNKHYLF